MLIQNEKKYQAFKDNLTYDPVGTKNDPGPYWRSTLPWKVDRNVLGDNKKVVLGTMNGTAKRLAKDPLWRKTYDEQLRVLIDSGFARKVSTEELDDG